MPAVPEGSVRAQRRFATQPLTPRFAAKKAPPYRQAYGNASSSATGVRLEFYPLDYPAEPPTPSFKVHGERCPQEGFYHTSAAHYAMSATPPIGGERSFSGGRGGVHVSHGLEGQGDYSSPTPPLFSKTA